MSDQPTDQPTERSTDRPADSPALESVDVAAVRLGISRNAVLQRIKRGTLSGQKVDGVWWVIVGDRFSGYVIDRPSGLTTEQPTDRTTDRPIDESSAVTTAARSQLEAIRDEWLAPLVAQITEQAETIGWLTAERDALQVRLSARAVEQEHPPTPEPTTPGTATQRVWWRFWER